MKRFYYELSGQHWAVYDRLAIFGGRTTPGPCTVCLVHEAEIASVICDALNTKYPQREDKL